MFEQLYKETYGQVTASPDTVQEVLKLKAKPKKNIRVVHLIAAVLAICLLTTSAFAYTGFVVYENPGQMLEAFFGLGARHGDDGVVEKDAYGTMHVTPSFERESLNADAAEKYIAPYTYQIEQTINAGSNTLTAKAVTYDASTQCGLVYLELENPEGFSGYHIESSGMLVWDGPDLVRSTNLGLTFFIADQYSTETSMTLAGYFYCPDYYKEDSFQIYLTSGQWTNDPSITIPLDTSGTMESITLGNGGIQLSSIGLVIHGDKLGILTGERETIVDQVVIRYADGTEYLVKDDTGEVPIVNFARGYAEPGDGYETPRKCVTYLLNRVVDLEQVTEVLVDGISYPID